MLWDRALQHLIVKYSFKTHFGVKLIFAYLCRNFFSPRVLLDESCHLSRQLRQLAHVWGPTSPAFNAGSLIGRSPTCCIKTLATLDGYRYWCLQAANGSWSVNLFGDPPCTVCPDPLIRSARLFGYSGYTTNAVGASVLCPVCLQDFLNIKFPPIKPSLLTLRPGRNSCLCEEAFASAFPWY